MTDRELMQQALDALFNLRWAASERDKKNRIRQFDEFMDNSDETIEALRARLAQPEQREVEIEFKEWIDPHIGVLQINPKTPLILKAVIRERDAPALERVNKAAEDNGEPR